MTNEKTLPGATVQFVSACTSGSSTNAYGVGSLSLQLYRPGNKYPWIDLGCINFSAPRPEQFEAAKKANAENPYNEDGQALSNIYRRLSKKQADYIQHLICEALTEKLKGEIPPDDEIDVIMNNGIKSETPD